MKKLIVGILTSFLIIISCFTNYSASAEITAEQELLNYYLSVTTRGIVSQGIPYTPSYFMDFDGWTNNKKYYDEFVSNSTNYPNRLYFTDICTDSYIQLRVYAYSEIISVSSSVGFSSFCECIFKLSLSSSTVTCSFNSYPDGGSKLIFISGCLENYISISCNNQSVILQDGNLLTESIDDKKTGGLFQGIKNLLTGKLSLFNVDVSLADKLSLLGDSFNNWFNDLLDVNVDVSSDEYNTLLNDLEYNTQNSSYINNVSQDTLTQIRNTYSNLKQCFDNSVSVYNDDNDNYYYTSNSSNNTYNTSNSDNVPNYTTYEGDTTQYFNTYIVDGSNTGGGSSSNSVSGGSRCNCNNSANAVVGDIIINNNIPSGSGSGTGTFDGDFDIFSFKYLLDKCTDFLNALKTGYTAIFPNDIITTLSCGILAVILCRFVGR